MKNTNPKISYQVWNLAWDKVHYNDQIYGRCWRQVKRQLKTPVQDQIRGQIWNRIIHQIWELNSK